MWEGPARLRDNVPHLSDKRQSQTVKNKLVPQQRLERGFNKQVALMMGGRSGGFQL